jgi:hypothetical protein
MKYESVACLASPTTWPARAGRSATDMTKYPYRVFCPDSFPQPPRSRRNDGSIEAREQVHQRYPPTKYSALAHSDALILTSNPHCSPILQVPPLAFWTVLCQLHPLPNLWLHSSTVMTTTFSRVDLRTMSPCRAILAMERVEIRQRSLLGIL